MTYMSRSAAEFWWKGKVPSNVHHYYMDTMKERKWITVTWQEIFDIRTAKQENHLLDKRACSKVKPGFIWVFHNNCSFFGGWWIYIRTLKEEFSVNFRAGDNPAMVAKAMSMFPLGFIPSAENFYEWAPVFAKTFPHKGFDRYRKGKQGLVKCYCHLSEYGRLEDISSVEGGLSKITVANNDCKISKIQARKSRKRTAQEEW